MVKEGEIEEEEEEERGRQMQTMKTLNYPPSSWSTTAVTLRCQDQMQIKISKFT